MTKDTKEIKKAYSKQVKLLNMETDIERYQQLRDAFKEAKAYAKNPDIVFDEEQEWEYFIEPDNQPIEELKEEPKEVRIYQRLERVNWQQDEEQDELVQDETEQNELNNYEQPNDQELDLEPEPQQRLERVDFQAEDQFVEANHGFFDELNQFIDLETYYADVEGWQNVLRNFSDYALDDFMYYQYQIKRFLLDYHQLLSFEVIQLILSLTNLNNKQNWVKRDEYLIFKEQLMTDNLLDYNCYVEIPKQDRFMYFNCRSKVRDTLFAESFDKEHPFKADLNVAYLKHAAFQDDDAKYLLACILLLQDKEKLDQNKDIILRDYFETMTSDKYVEDIKLIKMYFEEMEKFYSSDLTKEDFHLLQYTPVCLKKKLSKDVYFFGIKDKPRKEGEKSLFGKIVGVAAIVATLFLFWRVNLPVLIDSFESKYNEEEMIEDDEFTPKFNKIIFESLIEKEINKDLKMTTAGKAQFEALKKEQRQVWKKLGDEDLSFTYIDEKHNVMLGHQYQVQIAMPTDGDNQLEAVFNYADELEKIAYTKVKDGPEIGSLDAIHLFLGVLEASDNLEEYLDEVGYYGEDYLEKKLEKELLSNLKKERYQVLKSFYDCEIQLLDVQNQPVVSLTSKESGVIFLVLSKQNKIEKISDELGS